MKRALIAITYHRVLERVDTLRHGEVDVGTFTRQVQAIARAMHVLQGSDAVARLAEGRLPARAAMVTFDDGYLDNYEIARPILERAGIPATFFVATGFSAGGCMWNDVVIDAVERTRRTSVDAVRFGLATLDLATPAARSATLDALLHRLKYLPNTERSEQAQRVAEALEVEGAPRLMMQRPDIAKLAAAGFEIGAHTRSHPILRLLPEGEARAEIAGSKEDLESWLGRPVKLFAYPNGRPGEDYEAREMRLVSEAGFSAAFSTRSGPATLADDRFELPRIAVWDKSRIKLAARLLLLSARAR